MTEAHSEYTAAGGNELDDELLRTSFFSALPASYQHIKTAIRTQDFHDFEDMTASFMTLVMVAVLFRAWMMLMLSRLFSSRMTCLMCLVSSPSLLRCLVFRTLASRPHLFRHFFRQQVWMALLFAPLMLEV